MTKSRSGEEKYIEWMVEEANPEYDSMHPYYEEPEDYPEFSEEALEEARIDFDRDLQKYLGKPFKELLKDINGGTRISYNIFNGVDFYGASGGSMMANQVGWYLADASISNINASISKYYDIEVELMVR